MSWDELCIGEVVTGKEIKLGTIYNDNVNHDKRGKTGMPDAAILGKMVVAACRLKLTEGKGKGLDINVASCAVESGNLITTTICQKFVRDKRSHGVCYEDSILPVEIQVGHILVHQNIAPCKRCRAGYKAWAEGRRCTIVVSADEGYDQSGKNKVFIFTPTGLVFFG